MAAADYYRRGLTYSPDSPSPLYRLGYVYNDSRNYSEAVTQLQQLCASRNLNWEVMGEGERESFLDSLIRENELYSTHVGGTAVTMISPCHHCGREQRELLERHAE